MCANTIQANYSNNDRKHKCNKNMLWGAHLFVIFNRLAIPSPKSKPNTQRTKNENKSFIIYTWNKLD